MQKTSTLAVGFEDQIISELMPAVIEKINVAIEPIIRETLKQIIDETITNETMKLSEKSFAEVWENEEDRIWDNY
ncbi:MAG: hypothetical protein CVT89_05035 [Candidatus Altiarchaeales archaeon HGW-Altiarchaeales-2]|nr:MAG: hypothetical protein CVT89_05035 [Candidatus Altiarchaeales archaeon HGW-Altiarchaeales-2]